MDFGVDFWRRLWRGFPAGCVDLGCRFWRGFLALILARLFALGVRGFLVDFFAEGAKLQNRALPRNSPKIHTQNTTTISDPTGRLSKEEVERW